MIGRWDDGELELKGVFFIYLILSVHWTSPPTRIYQN